MVSVSQGHLDDSWKSAVGRAVRPAVSGDVGILICQISRMDSKAQNMLWRATADIFPFTFGFLYTSWRVEFQHDPIKSKMLFQRLDFLFAELNHTPACKTCKRQISGQIYSIDFILPFHHSEILGGFSYRSFMHDPLCGAFSHGFISAPLFFSPKGLNEGK